MGMARSHHLIKYFFDVKSPYAYMGFEILTRLKAKHNSLAVEWRPVLVPSIFKSVLFSVFSVSNAHFFKHLNVPPPLTTLPEKAAYLPHDLRRSFAFLGLDANVPDTDKIVPYLRAANTAAANRLLIAVQENQPEMLEPAIRALFDRMWRTHQPMHEDENLIEVLFTIGISDNNARILVERSKTEELQQQYEKNTKEVIEDKGFGVPWMKVLRAGDEKHESFFGSDRFHLVEAFLKL